MMKKLIYDLRQRHKDYQQLFGSEVGQRVLHDLMRHCHVMRPTFQANSERLSAFREGERNVVLRILSLINHDHPFMNLTEIQNPKENNDE